DERTRASKVLAGPKAQRYAGDRQQFIFYLGQALYAAKIISYAQGFMLLREAAKEFKWNLNYGGIALMWKGGCIIRSAFLGDIKSAYVKQPNIESLLFDPFFQKALTDAQDGWRFVAANSALLGIPTPAITTALSFYDGYRTERLPANLLQAQRDYFGAHTYELLERPGEWVHTNWTGRGGNVSSSTYDA
ncbi:phosphogluconate dehydrogenase (decarboxylating) gnd1, partial [Tieghemiomyces parasiticus]